MVNSNQKGKKGEREWAKFCREQGYDVRRTQQYAGGMEESADCVGLPGIHQEVKRVERLNILDAYEQALIDSIGTGKIPIVAHRKNKHNWMVTMSAEDWFTLYREWEAGRAIEESEVKP